MKLNNDWNPPILSHTGHIIVDESSSITLTSYDLAKSLSCAPEGFTHPVLTFSTLGQDLKIGFFFQEFNLNHSHEYLEIGDGSFRHGRKDTSRLARFSGTALPSNVTSVSNVAWLSVDIPWTNTLTDLRLTIGAVNIPSMYYSKDIYHLIFNLLLMLGRIMWYLLLFSSI